MGEGGIMAAESRSPSSSLQSLPTAHAAAEELSSNEQTTMPQPAQEEALPRHPVQLFSVGDDPSSRHLRVSCRDQVGLLFKLCEILTSHGIDIRCAEIETQNGIVSNRFDLQTCRPSHFADANDWCQELEEFIAGANDDAGKAAKLEGSLAAVSKQLSVNPDLLSVVNFSQIKEHDGPPNQLRYRLELEGINQAGLLTYACFVFVRSGFSVVGASISTTDGHFSDTFELSTLCAEAEHRLRSYLVVPTLLSSGYNISLPFHATKSDVDLAGFMRHWSPGSPHASQHSLSTLCHSPGTASPNWISVASPGDQQAPLEQNDDTVSETWTFDLEDVPADMRVPPTQVPKSASSKAARSRVGSNLSSRGRAGSDLSMMSGFSALPEVPEGSTDATRNRVTRSTSQRKEISFANGDHYEGKSMVFEDGEKRHGFGTYTYSNSHETYKQYRGQWREDKKHGHGILFYRNGGVYAGQWRENHKHGLGVLLENSGEGDGLNLMPSCRYEGQWEEDEPHGLGVEENEKSSFFGCFSRGTRTGRGVHMEHSRTGSMCCEFVDGCTRVPLEEALWVQLSHLLERPGADTPPEASSMTYHFGTSSEAKVRPSLASLVYDDSGSAAYPGSPPAVGSPDSSANNSANNSETTAKTLSPGDRHPQGGRHRSASGGGSDNSGNNSGSTVTANALSPRQVGRHQAMFRRDVPSPRTTPRLSGGTRSWGPALTPKERLSERRATSGGNISGCAAMLDSPQSPHEEVAFTMNIGSEVAFSLNEENNLLSPVEHDAAQDANMEQTGDPSRLATGSSSSSAPRVWQPGAKGERRQVRVSPLLWSEDELAAFFACLGMKSTVCERVMLQRLKGAAQLLEMSNSEMRRQFGLLSPVERLVVRESLKRLLDADRWENKVRGYRAGDLLSDSVLGEFLVPAQEMKLVDMISQGGYGTVYKGLYTPKSDRCGLQANEAHQVAVKEMKGERRVRLYELLKEACVMASLKHPNICQFIGVCVDTTGRKHCIVSQLMDGSLFDIIHQPFKLQWNGDLTVKLVVNISKGICAGIAYLHNMSLVHADLKSSNILIDLSSSTKLVPRICDFGHAAVRSFPAPHHRCGTPHWAAPEVLRGEALGPEADTYSFGVVLWEMLAQRLPHKGLSFGQVLASVGWAGWTPDFEQLPELPSELRRLLRGCLKFLPQDRPASKKVQEQLKQMAKQANLKACSMLSAFFG